MLKYSIVLALFAVCLHSTSAQLTVSAASSLAPVLEKASAVFKAQHPDISIEFNYGASGALQRQVEHGAPVDVFLSAAPQPMDALEQAGLLLPGSRRNIAGNTLVLIVPDGASAPADFSALTTSGVTRLAIGEPRSVPVGAYAREMLLTLGLWKDLQNKIVLAKDARQVLTYVESGNVEAGIVYATDAMTSSKVRVAAIAPDRSHSPVVYPGAVLKQSRHPKEAALFLDSLHSASVVAIFEKSGFSIPTEN